VAERPIVLQKYSKGALSGATPAQPCVKAALMALNGQRGIAAKAGAC